MTTATTATTAPGDAIAPPRGGLRAPCPCGSGKRYKQCHGRTASREAFVPRPFEGLAGEADLVALRELVPAGTLTTRTVDGEEVVLVSVLPMAWPGLRRPDGAVWVGLQTAGSSSDPSRDLAVALRAAREAGPGTPVAHVDPRGRGERLQDVLDPSARPVVRVHAGMDFWLEGLGEDDEIGEPGTAAAVRASLEKVNESLVPTEAVTSVPSAYWVRLGGTTFVRWVVTVPEDDFMDALARLHAGRGDGAGGSALGGGTRFAGAFRTAGLLVPVWDLGPESTAESVEEPLAAFADRLSEALSDRTRSPPTSAAPEPASSAANSPSADPAQPPNLPTPCAP
ncbi:MAG: DUF5926 family protein, partial [Kineosporiaceae bacterium]